MSPARAPLKASFVLETNLGGVAVTFCACGVLMLPGTISHKHIESCPAALEAEAAGSSTRETQP